jgi:hypothetical protein
MTNWVRVKRFAELTGYTEDAVRTKIDRGVWLEGLVWMRAPDNSIVMSIRGYETWVEGRECVPQNPARSKSVSRLTASNAANA